MTTGILIFTRITLTICVAGVRTINQHGFHILHQSVGYMFFDLSDRINSSLLKFDYEKNVVNFEYC